MAHLTCTFHSKALGYRTRVEVYLPQPERDSPSWSVSKLDQKIPVLYLLHGYT